ncbi:MAG: CCA tRNA nucleotidyltransferase [Dehalococcoidales bacterium]|nr:CCA tRNA nucleotidyltransferase [Dehalococcoidales bacterium]
MPSLVMEDKKLPIESAASRVLNEISRFLAAKDVPACIVGGFVRDMLMGRTTADIDIAVSADALEVASQAAIALDGKFVLLDDVNPTGRVVLPDEKIQVDFTSFKGDILEDLARRDFTIDAMAIELKEGVVPDIKNIIDPYDGQADLRHHTVRAVNDNIFRDDAVRLLRGVRLAAELDFTIDNHTEKLISRDGSLIGGVAGERIREELLRLLALPGAGPRLFHLDKLGLLTALFPELVASRGVEQPKEHAWDVFEHSLQTVAALEFILRESPWEYAGKEALDFVPWSERLVKHFDREISSGSTGGSLLKLAALFHDIAKPQTKAIQDGRTRFLGHADIGADTTSAIMARLRFSKREIQLVELLVKYHLRPTQMSHEGMPTDRAIYRYFRDTGEAGIDLLYLCLADHLAARASALDLDEWREHCRMTEYVLDKHFVVKDTAAPPKILDGHDIMSIFNLEPGPKVGKLLEELREAQAAGEISTREEAMAYIKRLLSEMK